MILVEISVDIDSAGDVKYISQIFLQTHHLTSILFSCFEITGEHRKVKMPSNTLIQAKEFLVKLTFKNKVSVPVLISHKLNTTSFLEMWDDQSWHELLRLISCIRKLTVPINSIFPMNYLCPWISLR